MLKLTLLRHAKSSWDYATLDDHLRPLNNRGYRQVKRLAERFPKDVDAIWCSPAIRAYSTAFHLLEMNPELYGIFHLKPEIYQANASQLLQILTKDGNGKHIVLVAHNPGLEILAEDLLGVTIPLKTAHLVQLNLNCDKWSSISPQCATLECLWRPD